MFMKDLEQNKQKKLAQSEWQKEGFLLKWDNAWLLGSGPFLPVKGKASDKWHVFRPSFFYNKSEGEPESKNIHPIWQIPFVTAVFYSKKELLNFLNHSLNKKQSPFKLKWEPPNFSQFKKVFLKAKADIKNNDLKKVTPVFFETADYTFEPKDITFLLYRALNYTPKQQAVLPFDTPVNPAGVYGFWSNKYAMIGYTPEFLLKSQGGFLSTMALAGTAKNSKTLMTNPKEQKEHKWVVDAIKDILKPLKGYKRYSETYPYATGRLRHLRTDFYLQLLRKHPFEELVKLLHPTPALGGVPKQKALELLWEWDHSPERAYFGAPFGVAKNNTACIFTTIRNVQFTANKAYIGSGCGLVEDSVLEKEWEELKQKRQAVKDLFLL